MKSMKIRIAILAFFIALTASEGTQLNQRADPSQIAGDKFAFSLVGGFPSNPEKAAWRRITKICFYEDQLFILDKSQNEIFVYNLSGEFLKTIGRPGQGPGELEKPQDMAIGQDGRIFVLNAMGLSIAEFGSDGQFVDNIKLELPATSTFTFADSLALASPSGFYVTYVLSPHVLDLFDSSGRFIRTLVTREDAIKMPGASLGNCSCLLSLETVLLLLDQFNGVFKEVESTGNIRRTYSASSQEHERAVAIVRKSIEEKNKGDLMGVQVETNLLWSRPCIDQDGNIYCFFLLKRDGEKQRLNIFSREGRLLSGTSLDNAAGDRIVDLYQYKGNFFFVTEDQEISIILIFDSCEALLKIRSHKISDLRLKKSPRL